MKEEINYQDLHQKLSPKKTYKLSEVQNQLVKVAFDVVKFQDNDIEGLWKIEKDEQGEYIVALYDDSELTKSASIPWQVKVEQDNSCLIFYKDEPVTKISLSSLNIPISEHSLVKSYLPNKLANNQTLVKSLIQSIDNKHLQKICQKYPEFTKLADYSL